MFCTLSDFAIGNREKTEGWLCPLHQTIERRDETHNDQSPLRNVESGKLRKIQSPAHHPSCLFIVTTSWIGVTFFCP
ncbi:unnamed protein product [Sphagnum troendelagicum]|uniref:Uncharacterized protein n=1 Tax=Sphagnum troendelagicum TaxID=128251 RepID=A0ABP0USK6_9BRYO